MLTSSRDEFDEPPSRAAKRSTHRNQRALTQEREARIATKGVLKHARGAHITKAASYNDSHNKQYENAKPTNDEQAETETTKTTRNE